MPKLLIAIEEAEDLLNIFQTQTCKVSCKVNPQWANRNKSRLLFSSAEMFKKPLWQIVCTQIRLFWVHPVASILNLSVLFGNYLQQTISADDIFKCDFFLAL